MKLIYLAPVALLAATTMAQADKACKLPVKDLSSKELEEYRQLKDKKQKTKFLKKLCSKRKDKGGDKNDQDGDFMAMAEKFMKMTEERFAGMDKMAEDMGRMMRSFDQRVSRLEGGMKKLMNFMKYMKGDGEYMEDEEMLAKIAEFLKMELSEEDRMKKIFNFVKVQTEMRFAAYDESMHDMMIEQMLMKAVEFTTKMMAYDPENDNAAFYANCLDAYAMTEQAHAEFDHGDMTEEEIIQHVQEDYQANQPDCYAGMMEIYNSFHADIMGRAENLYEDKMENMEDEAKKQEMMDCYDAHNQIKIDYQDDHEAGYEYWKTNYEVCAKDFDQYWWYAFMQFKSEMGVKIAKFMMPELDAAMPAEMPESMPEEEDEAADDKQEKKGKYGYGY